MKIVVIQPALPFYRYDFFDKVFAGLNNDFLVFFTPSSMGVLTQPSFDRPWAHKLKSLARFPFGFFWQKGIVRVFLEKADVIVLFGNPRYLNVILCFIFYKLIGSKVVWWGHLKSSSSSTFGFYLRSIFMSFSDAILFYTDVEADCFRSSSHIRPKKMKIYALNNGINVRPIVEKRVRYFSSKRDHSLLFIGRLTEKSKFSLLLHALACLNDNSPKLHVIGDGNQKAALMELASHLNVSSRITWHGGQTDESYIAQIANRCAAFVYPGEVGLSLIHAMAYGLPAVVHSDPRQHMPEIAAFTLGETGLDFECGNAASLAQAILELLDDREFLEKCSARAIELADNVYNTQSMAERFIAMIKDLQSR